MRTWNSALSGLILGSVAFATTACTEDISSSDLRTRGMYADFSAVADGGGETTVTAQIRAGGKNANVYANIDGDDELFATVAKEEKDLRSIGNRQYSADFKEDEGGTKVKVSLTRGEDDDGAPDSDVTLPESFKLSLESEKTIARGEPIEISWEPSDKTGDMNWKMRSDCTFLAGDKGIADDGAFTIKASDHKQLGDEDDNEECKVTITVDRVVEGDVDDAFGGGVIYGIQRRTVTFTSVGPGEDPKDGVDGGGTPVEEPDAGGDPETDAGGSKADAGGGDPETDAGAPEADAGGDPETDAGPTMGDAGAMGDAGQ